MEEEITLEKIKKLIDKRVQWVGNISQTGKFRKVPLNFDGLLNAVLAGAIPNLAPHFKEINTSEKAIEVILNYLMTTKDISSSHFPTLLQKSEAPNYQFYEYKLSSEEKTRKEILNWLLTFYYIDLIKLEGKKLKQRVIVGIRTDNPKIEKIIRDYLLRGGVFDFEIKTGRIEEEYFDKRITYYLPSLPSAAYFTLLLLISTILNTLQFENQGELFENLSFEVLILSNSGGKKWSVVYHPIGNLSRLYNLFFRELNFPKSKFIVFLESLMPPSLQNKNIVESYYSLLSDLAFSILVEGYLNVNKLSKVIGEKISLELRAKRENKTHKLGKIYYANYVQTKFFGGESMDEDFEKLKKQMKAIALKIGELAKKGETQKSLLKRIIMDTKNEEIPVYFVETLVSYLPRLEREGIKIMLPEKLVTLPIRQFLILKNEFVVTLWNSYTGDSNKTNGGEKV
ncbi:hypothetical protein [Thermococcus sibiricus]|uniref:Uncharacterized protein n=1 Tax=Thermococcus sibiricus (strain DSM 12597 / MM 739) TaxID=604354 RepID=C6A4J3_THESM|nr:hypothetical protein [Thermococcus sibiricus]ACS90538.1 hypothetical protein TSIB_1487 [Thermococcus sibiricus MM 739]KUK27970.1 MAG: Uncharacterized protein XD61_1484 [Thermococcus sp. 40_45]